MPEELTPSEHEKKLAKSARHKSKPTYAKPALIVAAVILLCGVSFVSGENYQKHHGTAAAARFGSQGQGMPSDFGGGQRLPANIGTVTAVSSDSITLKNTRSGSSQTFKLTSSTVIDNNGSTGSASDIKTGDTVFIREDASDPSTASRIILNPSMMQGPQNDAGPSQSDPLSN